MRIWHTATLCVLSSALGCPSAAPDPGSDDDSDAVDDDDSTPPDSLADVLGVFNLTNVVRADGTSYVDLSGAFGTFVQRDVQPFSPAGYLQTFSYGADAPFWRFDLGGWPLPAEGESTIVTPATWLAWTPADEQWWDGGPRIGVGNYLSRRLDFDDVRAYQVDDPLVPGAASWTPGGALAWDSPGGDDVVAWAAPGAVPLPDAVALLEPAEGATVEAPAALPLTVRWTPADDGSFVTLALLRDRESAAWIARVPDTGSFEVPAATLHDDLGPGEATLVLGRTLDTLLPHPQGDILLRSREERRATVRLLPDVQLDPPFGRPGESLAVDARWWTAAWLPGATADFGEGVTVLSITPDPVDTHRATLLLDLAPDAALGGRDVALSTALDSVALPGGFTVLDLLPQDTCPVAEAAAPLAPGTWQGTTASATDDLRAYDCVPWSLGAADTIYRVELEAGETLAATLYAPAPSDGALALLSDCGDGLSAVACADVGFEGDPESLSFTAEEGGVYYLSVDGYFFAGEGQAFSGPFSLTVQTQTTPLSPRWIRPGDSQSFTLENPQPWGAVQLADVDLGTDIVVEAVSPAGPPRELAILATAAAAAPPGPRTVRVQDPDLGLLSFEDALYVTDWPAFDGCADAVGEPVQPGVGLGYAPVTNTIDSVSCFDWPSAGPEVVLPMDLLAGQVLTAEASADDDVQLYVLADCADPESCLAGADDTEAGGAETLDFEVPADGRYFVVVDVYGGLQDPLGPLRFDLSLDLR